MNKIIVCDIDGTIADLSHRLHYIQDKKGNKLDNPNWCMFFAECDVDKPIKNIIEMIEKLSDTYDIVYCTGRTVATYDKTIKWLKENVKIKNFSLLMRKDGDYRPDTEIKTEALKSYLSFREKPEVAFILEDKNSMVKKWRELGYTCLQVADGNF